MRKCKCIETSDNNSFTIGKTYEVDEYNHILADDVGDRRMFNVKTSVCHRFELVPETETAQEVDMGWEATTQTIFDLIEYDSESDLTVAHNLHSHTSFKVFDRNDGSVYTVTVTKGE